MNWLSAILAFLGGVARWWAERQFHRRDAAEDAQVEMAAEIADADRKRANEIRDRVDAGRLGGGLHSDRPDDNRGYRD